MLIKRILFDIFNLFLSSVISPPSKKPKHTETKEKLQKKPAEALTSIWVLSVAEKHFNSWKSQESVDEKQIGSYSSKTKAIENAKVAMSNLPMCEDIFDKGGRMKMDDTDWETVEDNSGSLGEHGGVLFNVEGFEGDGWHVSINRVNLDRPILKGTEDDEDEENENGSDYSGPDYDDDEY